MALVLSQFDFPSLSARDRSGQSKRSKRSGKRAGPANAKLHDVAVLLIPSPRLFTPASASPEDLFRGSYDLSQDTWLPRLVDPKTLQPGRIVWGKVSVQKVLEVQGKSRFGRQYQRCDAQEYNTHLGTLIEAPPEPVAGDGFQPVRNGLKKKKGAMAMISTLQQMELADMTENPSYTKGERPMVILKTDTPRVGYHLVLLLATFDGDGLRDSDKFTRSVSYPVKGSAAAHTWLDWQNGQMVPIKNTPVDLPIVPRYSRGSRCEQYLIALAMPIRASSMVDMGDEVVVPLPQVEMLTGLMLRHTRFTEAERNTLMLSL